MQASLTISCGASGWHVEGTAVTALDCEATLPPTLSPTTYSPTPPPPTGNPTGSPTPAPQVKVTPPAGAHRRLLSAQVSSGGACDTQKECEQYLTCRDDGYGSKKCLPPVEGSASWSFHSHAQVSDVNSWAVSNWQSGVTLSTLELYGGVADTLGVRTQKSLTRCYPAFPWIMRVKSTVLLPPPKPPVSPNQLAPVSPARLPTLA